MAVFSFCQRAVSSASFSLESASSAWRATSRSLDAASVSFCSATSSISSRRTIRSTASISSGRESISILSRLAASSTRSIALSGRNRWVMYRSERVAAETSAESVMRTPWCTSYRSLSPRRMPTVSSTLGSPT